MTVRPSSAVLVLATIVANAALAGSQPDTPREAPPPPRLLILTASGSEGDDAGRPAVETALLQSLTASGFPVVEPAQAEKIRQHEIQSQAIASADRERIAAIGQQHDADVVVVLHLRSEAEPSVGRFFSGRAVLQLDAYRASSAEYLGAHSVEVGGNSTRGELGTSALLARNAACRKAGELGAERLAGVLREALGRSQPVVVVIFGPALAEAKQIRQHLASLAGVQGLRQTYFAAGEKLELSVEHADPPVLGEALDGAAIGKRHLILLRNEPWRLTLELKP